jgi:hypothetical protein
MSSNRIFDDDMQTNLERDVIPFPDVPSKIDNSLHPLYLSLDFCIEVFLFHFREAEEMYRARITGCRILGDEWS